MEIPGTTEAPRRLDILVQGRTLPAFLTDAGVPHLVVFVKDVDLVPVQSLGAALRHAPEVGPDGANVNFVSPSPAPPFRMRTFERGTESETLACGTGATAVAWTLYKLGLSGLKVDLLTRSLRGLTVELQDSPGPGPRFFLTGEARFVYRGYLSQEAIQEASQC
jgi:diaminopimelate epimerase